MRGRLLFVAGLATGYVLGSRAGRQAYARIQSGWQGVRTSAPVRSTLEKARGLAEQKAPRLTSTVTGLASGAGSTVADVAESVHQAGEQAVVPVADSPVGAEATGTDAAGGGDLVEGSPGVGPVGAEATTDSKEGDDVER